MLTQLATLKARLVISDLDPQFDALLTNAIKAVSTRFDRECNRTLGRAENATEEFTADATDIAVGCYPIESVAKFELKRNEAEGWAEQAGVECLVRAGCVVSLGRPLGTRREIARITYTGGYVMPGSVPGTGQSPLPDDLEQAAVEQVAYWFQNRDRLGLSRLWEYHGTYRQIAELDLLPSVRAVLEQYRRFFL